MGNSIPKPTCESAHPDRGGCNTDPKCYYVNKVCGDKVQFYSLSDIPKTDIKCSIYPDTTVPDKFILYCINRNNVKNIIIKSIKITNCTALYRSECNILLPLNIERNEFALKRYMQTFNTVTGELTSRFPLTLDQVNGIKNNYNQITLTDIYDIDMYITVEMFDNKLESALLPDIEMLNLNIANTDKIRANLQALSS